MSNYNSQQSPHDQGQAGYGGHFRMPPPTWDRQPNERFMHQNQRLPTGGNAHQDIGGSHIRPPLNYNKFYQENPNAPHGPTQFTHGHHAQRFPGPHEHYPGPFSGPQPPFPPPRSNQFNHHAPPHHFHPPPFPGAPAMGGFHDTGNSSGNPITDWTAPSRNTSFQVNSSSEDHQIETSSSSEDQTWLNNWLDKNKISHRLKEQKGEAVTVKIPEAKKLFREAMGIYEDLQMLQKELAQSVNGNEDDWNLRLAQITKKKKRLDVIKQLLDKETIEGLSMKNLRVQAKRARMKKNSIKAHKDKLERRERAHRKIDAQLSEVRKVEDEKKRDKEMKKAADETLGEVRKKLSEAQKAADLIKALSKLRQLRKEAAEKRGIFMMSDMETNFEKKTSVLSAMLEKQLETYGAEKRVLEALLEQEAEESKEREAHAIKKQIQELERRKEKTIKRFLFGKEERLDEDDPLNQFRRYYDVADSRIEVLVQIRREWDRFLVPPNTGGSRIPEGWVLPPEPSSTVWASALKINND